MQKAVFSGEGGYSPIREYILTDGDMISTMY